MKDGNNSVAELMSTVQSIVAAKPYSECYLKEINSDFKRIKKYFDERGITAYSPEAGEAFLHDICGITPGVQSSKSTCAQRVVNMLTEYQRLGVVVPRRTLGRDFPTLFAPYANGYIEKLKKDFKRPQTILRTKTILLKFSEYLDQNGFKDLSSLTADDVNRYYTKCLNNYGKKYVHDNINCVRRFLHYLYEIGVMQSDISVRLLKVHCSSSPKHLPDTFTDEEIERILSAVDLDNPVGKRDYAILLVAARLGLRQSDIRNLKFSNIDWDTGTIRIVQIKTNQPLELPLPRDVGWAIINYLKSARPKCDASEIFVRHMAPYVPLTNYDWILSKYMRLAGISLVNRYHHGFHTFRHSLATRMLKANISLTDIQETLGHTIIGTTKIYTGVDTEQLASCALEVPML